MSSDKECKAVQVQTQFPKFKINTLETYFSLIKISLRAMAASFTTVAMLLIFQTQVEQSDC